MGNGRLDLVQALQSQPVGTGSDFAVSPSPNNATINAGQPATFTVTATPSGSFTQTVTWSCSGAPPNSTCAVSPSSVPLDGTNPANEWNARRRSEEHTSELQSPCNLVCRLLLEKKKK